MTTLEVLGTTRLPDDDPLATVAERIPLAYARFGQERVSTERPSPVGVRPFGLRFTLALAAAEPVPAWRYCPDRQIALGEDGEPWHRSLSDATKGTTGQSTDGGPSTGGEEWTPDYMSDETA